MIKVLQPFVPHYREEFFDGLSKDVEIELLCYDTQNLHKGGFKAASVKTKPVSKINLGPFLFYSIFPFIMGDKMVLMLNVSHISTWFLLLTKKFHKKEVILWGHGISVKRYIKEASAPNFFMKLMIKYADKVWLYTEAEKKIWLNFVGGDKLFALNNTISNIDSILSVVKPDKKKIREKYGITANRVLIYCARFETPFRRTDLLIEVMNSLGSDYQLLVIGDGHFKPDFSKLGNVIDFGAVYDRNVKSELFYASDVYFQPGWVGLSIVEAMAYSLPVLTFKRSKETLQCVEYYYLEDEYNSIIVYSVEELVKKLRGKSDEMLRALGDNAFEYASQKLRMSNMVNRARASLAIKMDI